MRFIREQLKHFFFTEAGDASGLRRKAAGVFIFGFAVPIILSFLYPNVLSDVTRRYIPMAEAFARGDFAFVVHPRFPYLFQSLAGILAAAGIPGKAAVILAASAANGGVCVLIYLIGLRIFGHGAAMLGVIYFLFASRCAGGGAAGMREPLSIFGFMLCIYGALKLARAKPDGRVMCYWIIGAIILANTRTEGLAVTLALLAALVVYELCRREFPWRAMLVSLAVFVSLLPSIYANYRMIGYPLPVARMADLMQKSAAGSKILSRIYNPDNFLVSGIPVKSDGSIPIPETPTVSPSPEEGRPYWVEVRDVPVPFGPRLLHQFNKGMCFYALFPVLILFIIRIRRRETTREEWILAGTYLLYAGFITFLMHLESPERFAMDARYLGPTIPLIMPGIGAVLAAINHFWRDRWPRSYSLRRAIALLVVCCLAATIGDLAPKLPTSKRRQSDLQSLFYAAEWIKQDFAPVQPKRMTRVPLSMADYHPPTRPIVHAEGTDRLRLTGFLCGGQTAFENNTPPADYIVYGSSEFDGDELSQYILVDFMVNLRGEKIRIFRRKGLK